MSFNSKQRPFWLEQCSKETFDLVVIGGGITGAGIALDAAARGWKVALFEKCDFAWGTSSRSTKLIHGGLRYLKQLELGLVREVGIERAVVHDNARHVVLSERMLLPIVEGGSLGKRLSSFGLWLYDRLAGVDKSERRRMLSVAETGQAEPLLRSDILRGGGLYYEYRTDDARLTIEILKTAVELGAVCLNYCPVVDFVYESGKESKISGVRIQDAAELAESATIEVKARAVVNAAGPWVDELRAKDSEGVRGKRLHLTKGVHIVVPFRRLPLRQSAYFDAPGDKRMVFAIPRFDVTYIGTTDTHYKEATDSPQADLSDVDYILAAANAMFPQAALNRNDVLSTWSGLRPLIHQDGKSPSELSRRDEIFVSGSGLISIAGGKLTGYRKMAERVVNLVGKRLHRSEPCTTATLRLSGGRFESNADFADFIRQCCQRYTELPEEQIRRLAYKYGSQTLLILQRFQSRRAYIPNADDCLHEAELWYGVEYEMVLNLRDYLIRRTGRLYFERPSIAARLALWADTLTQLLGWSEQQKQSEIEAFMKDYNSVMQWQEAVPKPE